MQLLKHENDNGWEPIAIDAIGHLSHPGDLQFITMIMIGEKTINTIST